MDFNTYVETRATSKQPHITHTQTEVFGLGQSPIKTVGSAEAVTSVGTFHFTIVKHIGHQAILGADLLKRGEAKFDFATETLYWFQRKFSLFSIWILTRN